MYKHSRIVSVYISGRTIAQITVCCVYLERKERKMKNSILILSLLIISSVVHATSTDPEDFESEQVKPRHGGVIHRFYGPWTSLHKRNGDYVDYNDYGARIPDPSPTLLDVPYDARPINEILPTIYTDRLFLLNSDYKWRPAGVADFRTGIRSVAAIDDEENDSNKAGRGGSVQ